MFRDLLSNHLWYRLSAGMLCVLLLNACEDVNKLQKEATNYYAFTSFRGNGESGLRLALSRDGLNWQTVAYDKSLLKPTVGGKLMRDPCVILGPDQRFHMVWTSSWEDRGIGIAHSDNLIEWSEQQFLPVMESEPTAKNAWAPEIFWDDSSKQYYIFWASTIPGKYPETEAAADKGWNHRIYHTTTTDFKNYSPTKLFYEPGFNVIDSTLVADSSRYYMILKEETRYPPAKNLRVATANSLLGPWETQAAAFTPKNIWVEGPSTLKIGERYFVYYDEYTEHRYGAMSTTDFINWRKESPRFPRGMRHGTALHIPKQVYHSLEKLK